MSTRYWDFKTESLVGGLVSEISDVPSSLRITVYEPDLTYFERHCQNRYQQFLGCVVDSNDIVPDEATWLKLCHGVLRVQMHLVNGPIYKRAGYRTDSPNKIIALTFEQMPVPRWMIDISREVARPMAEGWKLYVPYISPDPLYVGAEPRVSALGISVSQVCTLLPLLKALDERNCWEGKFESRVLGSEDVVIAPLCVVDGPYTFVSPDVASWRRKAFYLLRSFQNGCRRPVGGLTVQGDAWTQVRGTLAAHPEWVVNPSDRIPVAAPVVVQQVDEIQVLRSIMIGEAVLLTGEDTPRYFLFYQNDRQGLYNHWLSTGGLPQAALPTLESRIQVIVNALTCTARFPTDDTHSKSPSRNDPQKTVRTDRLPGPRGRKKKVKPKPPEMTRGDDSIVPSDKGTAQA